MRRGWLLYDERDLAVNRDFAAFMTDEAKKRELALETVTAERLRFGLRSGGTLSIRLDGAEALPDFVISRQRSALLSRQLERMGVPVFNNARVCELCNDKRETHQFLAGLPMLETEFADASRALPPLSYPRVVKPACSHGGDRVQLVQSEAQWREAMAAIAPESALTQEVAAQPGRDLRVYVVFGEIVAGVLRTARSGVVSNFKLGGHAALHELTSAERALAEAVVRRFAAEGAPLCFAGVDLLYHTAGPVLSEVEDVVGSRMLYKAGGPDVAALYLDGLRERLS